MIVLRYSPEAPKYNIPAEEKELPTKNMEKLVNGTRSVLLVWLLLMLFVCLCICM